MKIITAILAIVTVLLSVQPMVINAISLQAQKIPATHECCAKKQHTTSTQHNKQHKDDCCTNGQCSNPFLCCSNCVFIDRDRPIITASYVIVTVGKLLPANDDTLSSYAKECWHPPQLA